MPDSGHPEGRSEARHGRGGVKTTFRSLGSYNYRMWAAGSIVSNVGTWMQRVAQDWLVLTQLTHQNATAVGVVMALQFGPAFLLLPLTGYAADHLERRRILFATQTVMAVLALGLGVLTIGGWVRLGHVYAFAFLLGCASAFDAPARQTFVSELVGETSLSNAVALNSALFNTARLIGPAAAGLLIAALGTGWAFLVNALSYCAVLLSLALLRVQDLTRTARPAGSSHGFVEGFRYIRGRADLKTALLMMFLIGTFGLNFPIFISTMAVKTFGAGAGRYGLLTSMMAIGSVIGALLTARRTRPSIEHLLNSAAAFGIACGAAALAPNAITFGVVLIAVGLAAQTFTTSTNSLVQLSTDPAMRGRVIAILFAILMGATPLGAPPVGWVADRFGPRWALAIAALSGFAAALVGVAYRRRTRAAGLASQGGTGG
jgi:MFS family permease